ncbi:8475_t:CDS:2 [Funneliformis geosporum]|uniref:8475_t:CDS:1 n=1 Tax=Funneliformis geosporum TaxID=1117311 RepID=A0A9W4SE83_9GLOM|nr:8475_t:CDS:2 [Funneliformis geosporum]
MSKPKNYIFNNTFPDSYKFENVNELTDSETETQRIQVRSKIQSLITKFEEENREETGKGRSCWTYFNEMNEIFGNRENVRPDYLLSSINVDKSDIESEVDRTINQSKKMAIEIEQERLNFEKQKLEIKQNEKKLEREVILKIEQEKLKWEKEKFEKEQEFKLKLELERMNKEFELKIIDYLWKSRLISYPMNFGSLSKKNGYILADTQEEELFKLPDYDVDFTLKESINDKLPAYDENEEILIIIIRFKDVAFDDLNNSGNNHDEDYEDMIQQYYENDIHKILMRLRNCYQGSYNHA